MIRYSTVTAFHAYPIALTVPTEPSPCQCGLPSPSEIRPYPDGVTSPRDVLGLAVQATFAGSIDGPLGGLGLGPSGLLIGHGRCQTSTMRASSTPSLVSAKATRLLGAFW